ncbi:MAG: hypothetical protein JRH12_13635 [Deltaproteobacteria bacterium]|jgi:uncharacterized repeat protein (TIGR04076 family)|nr:hypothetical protein [Deltaproteobacteria bacterium]
MEVNEETWKFMQQHLGYTDEELEVFRSNPKNVDIMSKAPELMNKTIIAEVVASHGCASQHKVGDRFYFDGAGNLITKLNPKRICVHALSVLSGPMVVVNELVYAGVDSNEMRLNRVGCFDVGIQCGGWGHIAMEVKVEERK